MKLTNAPQGFNQKINLFDEAREKMIQAFREYLINLIGNEPESRDERQVLVNELNALRRRLDLDFVDVNSNEAAVLSISYRSFVVRTKSTPMQQISCEIDFPSLTTRDYKDLKKTKRK